jgi:phospholipid transport system substrate-binding protein
MKPFKIGLGRGHAHAAKVGAAVSLGMSALLASPTVEAKDETDPLLKLRRTDAEIRAIVALRVPEWSSEAPVRQTRIDRLLRGLLDYEAIARRALGDEFARLPPEQRRAFIEVFSALTSRTFLAKTEDQANPTIYDSEEIRGDQAYVSARGACGTAQTEVEYVLERRGDDWRVTDVVIDGVSMVAAYQEQFRALVAREGIDGLMARMRNRLSSGGN